MNLHIGPPLIGDLFGLTLGRPEALLLLLIVPAVALLAKSSWRTASSSRNQLLLRLAVVALLALTLADPLIVDSSANSSTVFVVDRSRSIDERSADSINGWISSALESAGVDEQVSVINFAASPDLSVSGVSPSAMGSEWQSSDAIDPEDTNIETALGMAQALPGGSGKRIVLISDGSEHSGNALNQAVQAAAENTGINVLPVPGTGADAIQITGVSALSTVWKGQPIQVIASVTSTVAMPGRIEILVDDVVKNSADLEFPLGSSTHPFDVTDLDPGFHAITVQVTPGGPDRYSENNVQTSALFVREAPKILMISSAGAEDSLIRASLERLGMQVDARTPAEIPSRTSDLSLYDATVIVNVPASEFTVDQMTAFKEVTSDGRGLIVLGGTSSFGVGGYANTVLEESLPVTVRVTEGKERQKVAFLIILDKSGSMGQEQSGEAKIELAKEAVRLASDVLLEGDEFGLLTFNSEAQWTVDLKAIESPADRDKIRAAVEGIKADGSTEIYAALEIGFQAFSQSDADVKHVVLMSDGVSSTGTRESYGKLIEEARANQITFSTIALGEDADLALLQFLADAGNGQHHYASSPEQIPQLTVEEAQSAGSQSILRGPFELIQLEPSTMMGEIDVEDLPDIDGYGYAEVKPNAHSILESRRNDPVLSQWQLGLGRVVTWTADDGVDFAKAWADWPQYDEFWSNVIQWALPDPENGPLQVATERSAGDTVVTLTSAITNGDYVNYEGAVATVVDTTGTVIVEDAELVQTAPGEYQVRLPDAPPGAYNLTLASPEGAEGDAVLLLDTGLTVPQSDELNVSPDAEQLLEDIAGATGGELLSFEDPSALFEIPTSESQSINSYRGLWWLPLALALGLFLAELASRYQFTSRFNGLRSSLRPPT